MPEQKIEQWMRDAAQEILGDCSATGVVYNEDFEEVAEIIAAHVPTPAPTAERESRDT